MAKDLVTNLVLAGKVDQSLNAAIENAKDQYAGLTSEAAKALTKATQAAETYQLSETQSQEISRLTQEFTNSMSALQQGLQTNELTLKEYKAQSANLKTLYQDNLKTLKIQQADEARLLKTQQEAQNTANAILAQDGKFEELKDKVTGVKSEVEAIPGEVDKIGASADVVNAKIKSWSTTLEAWATKVQSLGNAMSVITAPIEKFFKSSFTSSVTNESSLVEVMASFTFFSAEEEKKWTDLIEKSAYAISERGYKLSEIYGAMKENAQAGVAPENIEAMALLSLQGASSANIQNAATMISSFGQNLGVENTADFAEKVYSAMTRISNEYPTLGQDIASTLQNLAAGGAVAGFSPETIISLAGFLSASGMNPQAGGSAAVKILKDIATMASYSDSDLAAQYGQLFRVTADDGELREMTGAEMSSMVKENRNAAFAAIVHQLGAIEDDDERMLTLGALGLTGEVRKALAASMLATGSSKFEEIYNKILEEFQNPVALSEESAKRENSSEYRLQAFYNQLEELKIAVGDHLVPLVFKLTNPLGKIADWLSGLPDGVFDTIVGIGSVLIGGTKALTWTGNIAGAVSKIGALLGGGGTAAAAASGAGAAAASGAGTAVGTAVAAIGGGFSGTALGNALLSLGGLAALPAAFVLTHKLIQAIPTEFEKATANLGKIKVEVDETALSDLSERINAVIGEVQLLDPNSERWASLEKRVQAVLGGLNNSGIVADALGAVIGMADSDLSYAESTYKTQITQLYSAYEEALLSGADVSEIVSDMKALSEELETYQKSRKEEAETQTAGILETVLSKLADKRLLEFVELYKAIGVWEENRDEDEAQALMDQLNALGLINEENYSDQKIAQGNLAYFLGDYSAELLNLMQEKLSGVFGAESFKSTVPAALLTVLNSDYFDPEKLNEQSLAVIDLISLWAAYSKNNNLQPSEVDWRVMGLDAVDSLEEYINDLRDALNPVFEVSPIASNSVVVNNTYSPKITVTGNGVTASEVNRIVKENLDDYAQENERWQSSAYVGGLV